MAVARGAVPGKTESGRRSRKWLFACAASAFCVMGVFGYFHFDQTAASNVQRGDRIDFSSLASVVTIDDYSEGQVRGLSSGQKDHKIEHDLRPVTLATTGGTKTNFGEPSLEVAPKVATLVAKHAAKLQQHLERGLTSETPGQTAISEASAIANAQPPAVLPASLRPAKAAVVKVSNVRNGLGGGLSDSADGSTGGHGGLSGLLR